MSINTDEDDIELDDSLPEEDDIFAEIPDADEPVESVVGKNGRVNGKEKKPKATKEQKAEIGRVAEALLARAITQKEIVAILMKRYGMGERQADRYMSDARAALRAELNKHDDDHRAEAYSFYRQVQRNANAGIRDKMAAQDAIVRLLGLAKPIEVDVHHTHEIDINRELEQIRLNLLKDDRSLELMAELTERMHGLKMIPAEEVTIMPAADPDEEATSSG